MKTAFSAFLALLCMWLSGGPAKARILESNGDEDQIGSQDYGYVSAEDLWKNGKANYSCDNNCETIIHGYWRDVIKIVFPDCDSKWTGLWAEYADNCKMGAEDFTMERIGECFHVKDCHQLGVAAGSAVAGSFCKRDGLFHDRDWLPLKCIKHAEASCKCDAVNLIQQFSEDGVCASMVDTALEHVDKIHQLCEDEVYEMEQNAKLPWY